MEKEVQTSRINRVGRASQNSIWEKEILAVPEGLLEIWPTEKKEYGKEDKFREKRSWITFKLGKRN